jgi:hypothetical protein
MQIIYKNTILFSAHYLNDKYTSDYKSILICIFITKNKMK